MAGKKANGKIYTLALAILLAFTFAALSGAFGLKSDSDTASNAVSGDFEVHFIDVGQADSELVISDGKTMLIDGGNADDSNLIVSYLRDLNIDYLDYVVCTHAHEDHVGGLSGALHECGVGRVLCSTESYSSKAFGNFKRYSNKRGREIEIPSPGDSFSLGESSVEVFSPIKEYEDTNNNSIVLKVTYGDTSFLFTGDAEREVESDMLDGGFDLTADVLKVGHHGSSTSSSYPFLREVMPKYAVISCGRDNSYGHPHREPLSRLADVGAKIYRTDEQGHIIARSDGKNITFETQK